MPPKAQSKVKTIHKAKPDFKKLRRKAGKTAPTPQNQTRTTIKARGKPHSFGCDVLRCPFFVSHVRITCSETDLTQTIYFSISSHLTSLDSSPFQ